MSASLLTLWLSTVKVHARKSRICRILFPSRHLVIESRAVINVWEIDGRYVCVFPKCGSTVLADCFIQLGGSRLGRGEARRMVRAPHSEPIFVTRDPHRRVVSTYLDKCVRNPTLPGTNEKFGQPENFEEFLIKVAQGRIMDEHTISHALALFIFFGVRFATSLIRTQRFIVSDSPRATLSELGLSPSQIDTFLRFSSKHKISYKFAEATSASKIPTDLLRERQDFPRFSNFFNPNLSAIASKLYEVDLKVGLRKAATSL